MAKRSQQIIFNWLWPGCIAASAILLIAISAFVMLWIHSPEGSIQSIWNDSYIWHVVRFTFWQAFLSTLLSLLPAIPLARALYRRRFIGRDQVLRLCAMTLVLPVLVAVFGLLSVYGKQGWLSILLSYIGIEYQFSIYGLSGILLAHAFFNLPLATRLILQSLENIAVEQRQLAAQLGMSSWQQFRFVEWPKIRGQIMSTGAMIFMLCFASFATVLSLGGGPQATTIELAIYQSLSYDFDMGRAAILALIQLGCCIGLVAFSQHLSRALPSGFTQSLYWRNPEDSKRSRLTDTLLITLLLLLILPPILAVISDGINASLLQVLRQHALWQALATSLRISIASGVLCVVLTMMLLWSSRELQIRQRHNLAQKLELSGTLILAMPGIVLATGFFLLFNDTIGVPLHADGIIITTNALMAIPFALKILDAPMRDLAERYNPLALSLGMNIFQRLYWLEFKALKRPLTQALAFACILSIGDFGAIALFGNSEFRTLPYHLYQQLGAYRSNDGAVTAFILLVLCFILFSLIEKLPGRHATTQ